MNAKVIVAGLVVAGSLLAQPAAGQGGRGPMGLGARGGLGLGLGLGGPETRQTVTGAPYSAVEVRTVQQGLATGGVIQRTEQSNVYRDSQGRVRRETTRKLADGQTETNISIADPVAGLVYRLDAKNKTAFARPARFPAASNLPQGTGSGRLAQNAANVKSETLAARSINGMIASGTRVTHTIPAGTIGNSQVIETVREVWIADDLKVQLTAKTSDPRTGTRTMELTNINRNQPDPSLFQVPSDYTVKKGMGMGVRGAGRGAGGAALGAGRRR